MAGATGWADILGLLFDVGTFVRTNAPKVVSGTAPKAEDVEKLLGAAQRKLGTVQGQGAEWQNWKWVLNFLTKDEIQFFAEVVGNPANLPADRAANLIENLGRASGQREDEKEVVAQTLKKILDASNPDPGLCAHYLHIFRMTEPVDLESPMVKQIKEAVSFLKAQVGASGILKPADPVASAARVADMEDKIQQLKKRYKM